MNQRKVEKITTQRCKSSLWLSLTVAVACASLGIVSSLAPAHALPPRPPTPTFTVVAPTRSAPDSGSIELRVRFPAALPGRESPWQELWTVVQWQDPHTGTWRDVESWQGTLDGVRGEGGAVVGHKTWWVAQRDLGTGPFRWLVYRSQGGPLSVTSEPFDLPAGGGETVGVEVILE
jgi:hypothetical protein